jgi:hypothetical protein
VKIATILPDGETLSRLTAVRLGHPNALHLNRHWIGNVDEGRPGFAEHVRQVALEALASADASWAQKGIAALAAVGYVDDLDALAACGQRLGGQAATNARTAMFEIEHRARAS